MSRLRRLVLGTMAAVCAVGSATVPVPGQQPAGAAPSRPAQVDPAPISGRGSSYVGPAMTQWTADAYTQGLRVNYLATGSPDGLGQYQQSTVDFAGTEAEFSSLLGLGNDSQVRRGFQYVPDVAGAVAIMYNVSDRSGRKVDYLRLSRETVARIFLGDISNWSDPAITRDLGGQIVLPDRPITVVYRSEPSGTTALFYDFVQSMAPALFDQWVARNRYPRGVRIIDPGASPNFVPHPVGLARSDLMAQHVARTPWTITYDEFAYARQYNVTTAWIQNESRNWVQPYALNISQALESAELRPDLSQELSGVYRSRAPEAYPISAYSYIVTQCAPSADRATCRGNYANEGVAQTLDEWMRYIACDGQVQMDDIGYSPLPPNLSQEMMSSIQRMWGRPIAQATRLTQANCRNPRFDPNYRPPAPPTPPPLPDPPAAGADAGDAGEEAGEGADAEAEGAGAEQTAATDEAAAGREGDVRAVGGGSSDWRDSDPTAYRRPGLGPIGRWALVVLLLLIAAPLAGGPLWRRLRHLRHLRRT